MNVRQLKNVIDKLPDNMEVIPFVDGVGYRAVDATVSDDVHKQRIDYTKGEPGTRKRLVIDCQ